MLKAEFTKAVGLCCASLFMATSFSAIPATSRSIMAPAGTVLLIKSANISNKPQVSLNKKGISFVKKYLRNSNECLVSVKKRSSIPFAIIDSVFNHYGLPVELKYLAVIESELKPSALSHVGARGPWQLMPGTAQVLGLTVTRQVDERTNYYKSTVAAARYLKDLYAQFNDWLLVLAAYNGGPKPVYTAMRVSGSKNFWTLQNYLPAESRDHVKKFIATHYYFEGRGSETTLTKAENIQFKKMVIAFIKSNAIPVNPETKNASVHLHAATHKTELQNFELNQLVGYSCSTIPSTSEKNNSKMPVETSEQKFQRLMKESAESLKSSKRVI